jgi:hypothetical protein
VPVTIAAELPGPHDTVRAKLAAAARPPLVRDVIALARTKARLSRHQIRRGYRDALWHWSPPRLRDERGRLRADIRRLREERRRERIAARQAQEAANAAAAASTTPANLQAIAACESGGDPSAVDSSGTYRGKYQFDMQTWQSVGGSGDPAAAPEAEQDRRAAMLYARAGSSPWPVCGR